MPKQLLIYIQNVAMEAVIPTKWIDQQRPRLIEGRVYTIQYFEICNARAIYRSVDHPYMARFTKYTNITEVSAVPPNFPLYACCITPYAVLRDRVGRKEQMSGLICCFHLQNIFTVIWSACATTLNHVLHVVDVIGLFTKCSRISKQSTRNGIQSLINVYITYGRHPYAIQSM